MARPSCLRFASPIAGTPGKGSPLTNDEIDRNFPNVRAAILAMSGGVFVNELTQDQPSDVTFHYSDGFRQGPIVLPRQPVRFRGAYTTGQPYLVGDMVKHGDIIYLAAAEHLGIDPSWGIPSQLKALAGIPEASTDGKRYARQEGRWVEIPNPTPVWGLPKDHDERVAYDRFAVVAFDIEGETDLYVALAPVPADGAMPGNDGEPSTKMTR